MQPQAAKRSTETDGSKTTRASRRRKEQEKAAKDNAFTHNMEKELLGKPRRDRKAQDFVEYEKKSKAKIADLKAQITKMTDKNEIIKIKNKISA